MADERIRSPRRAHTADDVPAILRKLENASLNNKPTPIPFACVAIPLTIKIRKGAIDASSRVWGARLAAALDSIELLTKALAMDPLSRMLPAEVREAALHVLGPLGEETTALIADHKRVSLARVLVADELGADARWPDGVPAWRVRRENELAARLETFAKLEPIEIAVLYRYGNGGTHFRPKDAEGSLEDLSGRIRAQINDWHGTDTHHCPSCDDRAPAMTRTRAGRRAASASDDAPRTLKRPRRDR